MIRHVTDLGQVAVEGSDIEFLRSLGGPTLLEQSGQDGSRTRFVSTLLHGNEPSGTRALQRWLCERETPKTNTVFYIGSVHAALAAPEYSHRTLPGEPDANRCFVEPFNGPAGELSKRLIDDIRAMAPEALVDLHNNTGHNPAYAVLTRLDRTHAQLTRLFAAKCVLSDIRLGTLIEATEEICPSVVIECGLAGARQADEAAFQGLRAFLTKDDVFESVELEGPELEVLENPLRVTLQPGTALRYGDAPGPGFTLRVDLDRHNFELAAEGTVLGWLSPESEWPLLATGADGRDRSKDMFVLQGHTVFFRRPAIPVMMTQQVEIARSDCLFYLTSRRAASGS